MSASVDDDTAAGLAVVSDHRPRVVDDLALLGLSRASRGRVGSRVFTGFFVFVFILIAVQMIVALVTY